MQYLCIEFFNSMYVCEIWTHLLLLTGHLCSRISPSCLPLWHKIKVESIQFPSQIPLLQGELARGEATIQSRDCAEHGCIHCTLPEGPLSIQIFGKQQQDRDECAGPRSLGLGLCILLWLIWGSESVLVGDWITARRSGTNPLLHRGDSVLTRWEPAFLSLAWSRRSGTSFAYLPVFNIGYILICIIRYSKQYSQMRLNEG